MNLKILILVSLGLIQVFKFCKYHLKILKLSYLFRQLNKMKALTPTQLQNGIKNVSKYVLCKGSLKASQNCKSILSPQISIVYSKLFMNRLLKFQHSLHWIETYIRSKKPCFFKISDELNIVNIYETTKTNIQTIKKISKSNSIHPEFRIIFNLYSLLKRINFSLITKQQYEEHYIPDGFMGYVFGKISKNYLNEISFESPISIGMNKQNMLDDLNKSINLLKLKKLFLIGCLTACIACLCSILRKMYQEYQNKNQFPINKYNQIIVKSRVCMICRINISSMIQQNCGHLCLCEQCGSKNDKICAQCKKKTKDQISLFVC